MVRVSSHWVLVAEWSVTALAMQARELQVGHGGSCARFHCFCAFSIKMRHSVANLLLSVFGLDCCNGVWLVPGAYPLASVFLLRSEIVFLFWF
jgi:hypothetical protein